MAVLSIRQRTGWLFASITVMHLVLISAQVNTRRGVPMLEEAVFGGMAELQRVATGAIASVRGAWERYLALQRVEDENVRLREEAGRLRVSLQQERALAAQSRDLQRLLDLRNALEVPTAAASVIAGGASPDFRTVTIDKGRGQGLRSDMAVIAPAGVVGRVIMPSARAAKIQLLSDRNAAVAALVERSRAQGIVVGTGGDRLRMDYVSGTADLKVGDRVVTSGMDGIYPKGFSIGQIESVQRGAGEFTEVVVKSAVDFSSLEAVLVVLTPPATENEAPQ